MNKKPKQYSIIKKLMQSNNMDNVRDLSLESGVPQKTVYRYMNGYSKNLKAETKDKIASALGVESDEIFGSDENSGSDKTSDPSLKAYRKMKQAIVKYKYDLDDDYKNKLIAELLDKD